MKLYKEVDVLIIGAGPSGTVAATYLNNNGFNVLVVEKQKFPRFVIGESLLPRTLDHLEEVGLLEAVKKQGFQEKLGATFLANGKKCEFLFSEQFTKGFEYTWQVPRDKFDKILTDAAQEKGVEILFEHGVEFVDFQDGFQLTKISGEDKLINVKSKFVIDASGYGRVLPKQLNLGMNSSLKARSSVYTHLKNHFKKTEQQQNNVFIDTVNNDTKAWMWMIPFSNGKTSVGLVGDEEWVQTFTDNPKEKFLEVLAENNSINEVFEKIEFEFEPIIINGYSVGVKQMFGDGFVLVGNSTEFLDPVFSSGVMLATESGLLAAKLVARQLDGETIDWKNEYEAVIVSAVEVFRSYVNAWYDGTLHTIFFTNEIRQDVKNQICSVLAGYVLDKKNPFVKKHTRVLGNLAKVIKMG